MLVFGGVKKQPWETCWEESSSSWILKENPIEFGKMLGNVCEHIQDIHFMRHQIYLEIWSVINCLQLRIDAMCQSQWNVQFKTAGVFWHRFRFKKASGFLNECLGGATTSSKEIKWYSRDIYIFIYIDTYSYTNTYIYMYIHICFPSIPFRRKKNSSLKGQNKNSDAPGCCGVFALFDGSYGCRTPRVRGVWAETSGNGWWCFSLRNEASKTRNKVRVVEHQSGIFATWLFGIPLDLSNFIRGFLLTEGCCRCPLGNTWNHILECSLQN